MTSPEREPSGQPAYPEQGTASPVLEMERLRQLVETTSPEEMIDHPELSPIYRAARQIAVSSHNGRITTRPIEGLQDNHEPLVQKLLTRFEDEGGNIHFPFVAGGHKVGNLRVSATEVSQYKLQHRSGPATGKDIIYFSSDPQN